MRPLRLALVVPCTEAEGPGRRFAFWVQGCPPSLRCPGCCNPEMLAFEGGEEWDVQALAERILATPDIEGITLLGGEPVAQAAALAELCRRVRAGGGEGRPSREIAAPPGAEAPRPRVGTRLKPALSVMLFSGYELAQLRTMGPDVQDLLAQTDLLVDGRYDRSLPETRRRWIGSTNQVLHFLSDRYSPGDPAFAAPNTVEIRFSKDSLNVNGWPALAAALARGSR